MQSFPNAAQKEIQGQEQAQAPAVMSYQQAGQPRSIREYFQIAQAAGMAPRFSNVPQVVGSGQGMLVGGMAQGMDPRFGGAMPGGAIPNQPSQDPYERIPAADREAMDPYERASQRLPSLLPDIWAATFPGRPQNTMLTEDERKKWNKAVTEVSNRLLKNYDDAYGRQRKMVMENKDRLQAFYVRTGEMYDEIEANPSRQVPVDPETNMPVSREDFISKRMAAYKQQLADLYQYQEQGVGADKGEKVETPTSTGTTRAMVTQAFEADSALKNRVIDQARFAFNEASKMNLSRKAFLAIQSEGAPEHLQLWRESVQDAIQYYQDQIVRAWNKAKNKKKPAISPKGDITDIQPSFRGAGASGSWSEPTEGEKALASMPAIPVMS